MHWNNACLLDEQPKEAPITAGAYLAGTPP